MSAVDHDPARVARTLRNLRDCVDLGITVVLGGDSELTWDPARRALHLLPASETLLARRGYDVAKAMDEGLEHELGHHAVATAEERGLPDWALGRDSNRVGPSPTETVLLPRPANAVPGSPDRYETRPSRRPGQISDDGDRRAVEVAVLSWQLLRSGRHPGPWAAQGIRDDADHRVARRFASAGLDRGAVRAALYAADAAEVAS